MGTQHFAFAPGELPDAADILAFLPVEFKLAT
jgi:hypothetical protein